MELKILLVDDQKFIKLGLKKIIEEYNKNYIICGMASDVSEAIELVNELEPDLVITDLCMYEEMGFDLLEYLNEKKPHIKHFVISAYDEKEYLKRCIKLNTMEYLVKPIKKEELYKRLDKIYNKVLSERQTHEMEKKNKEYLEMMRKSFISLISGDETLNVENLVKLSRICGVNQMLDKYVVISLLVDMKSNISVENWNIEEYMVAIENIMMELLTENEFLAMSFEYKNQNIFIVSGSNELILSEAFILNSKAIISEVIARDVAISVSEVHSGIDELRDAIIQVIKGDNETCNNTSKTEAQGMLIHSKPFSNLRIEEIKQYIRKNYYKQITLTSLGNEFNLSPQYLSGVFKKETGHTIVEYMMLERIEKAKSLLEEIDLKIYEVGEMVGYSNQSYFAKIFKRMEGKTPEEYREEYLNRRINKNNLKK